MPIDFGNTFATFFSDSAVSCPASIPVSAAICAIDCCCAAGLDSALTTPPSLLIIAARAAPLATARSGSTNSGFLPVRRSTSLVTAVIREDPPTRMTSSIVSPGSFSFAVSNTRVKGISVCSSSGAVTRSKSSRVTAILAREPESLASRTVALSALLSASLQFTVCSCSLATKVSSFSASSSPVCSMNLSRINSLRALSQSAPPSRASPSVAITRKVLSIPCTIVASNVPPPRSYTSKVLSFRGCLES